MMERIICAACRFGGLIILGKRHYDAMMIEQIQFIKNAEFDVEKFTWEQGFINQYGDFLTRQEAWKVAVAADHITRRVGEDTADGGTLYSENLY